MRSWEVLVVALCGAAMGCIVLWRSARRTAWYWRWRLRRALASPADLDGWSDAEIWAASCRIPELEQWARLVWLRGAGADPVLAATRSYVAALRREHAFRSAPGPCPPVGSCDP